MVFQLPQKGFTVIPIIAGVVVLAVVLLLFFSPRTFSEIGFENNFSIFQKPGESLPTVGLEVVVTEEEIEQGFRQGFAEAAQTVNPVVGISVTLQEGVGTIVATLQDGEIITGTVSVSADKKRFIVESVHVQGARPLAESIYQSIGRNTLESVLANFLLEQSANNLESIEIQAGKLVLYYSRE